LQTEPYAEIFAQPDCPAVPIYAALFLANMTLAEFKNAPKSN